MVCPSNFVLMIVTMDVPTTLFSYIVVTAMIVEELLGQNVRLYQAKKNNQKCKRNNTKGHRVKDHKYGKEHVICNEEDIN